MGDVRTSEGRANCLWLQIGQHVSGFRIVDLDLCLTDWLAVLEIRHMVCCKHVESKRCAALAATARKGTRQDLVGSRFWLAVELRVWLGHVHDRKWFQMSVLPDP